MRNALQTSFWQGAYESLPGTVRHRYLAQIERAERWELALDTAIGTAAGMKRALARLFDTPAKARSAH